MARPKISEEQKKAEGAQLRHYLEEAQKREESLTQESLADEMGVSQGLIGQYIRGSTHIPDKRLIWLGKRLNFDPFTVRPSLSWIESASALTGSTKLAKVIAQIPHGDEDYMADILAQVLKGRSKDRQ